MRAIAAILLIAALVVNWAANTLPLGGRTTGELSAKYPNLFVPAGFTFSIWGVIYLGLMVWAVVQFLPGRGEMGRLLAPAFALTSVLNAGWLFAWHFGQVEVSVVIMAALLITLLTVNARLAGWAPDGLRGPAPGSARFAFGVYLGWISVALIANVTALLVAWRWDGMGLPDAAWAGIMVGVGALAGVLATLRLRNPWLGGAVTWALAGVAANRWNDEPVLVLVAGLGGLLVFAAALAAARTEAR